MAKTLSEALLRADIKMVIRETLMIGSLFNIDDRIDAAETLIMKNVRKQLKDLFSQRCQVFGFKNSCDREMQIFFEDIFKDEK